MNVVVVEVVVTVVVVAMVVAESVLGVAVRLHKWGD